MKFSIHIARKIRATGFAAAVLLVVQCGTSMATVPAIQPWMQVGEPGTDRVGMEEEPPVAPIVAPPVAASLSPAPPPVLVSEESLAEAEAGSMGYGIRAAGATIVVLGLIWMTMLLLKRYMPHRFGPLGQKRRIHVLETVTIGEKRTLALVRVDNEELLLAGTPGSLSLLKELRREVQSDTPAQQESRSAEARQTSDSSSRSGDAGLRFEEVLADEVQAVPQASGPLSRLTLLRQKLEAR
jgi:flagellar biogenesis protein FliO